MTTVLLGVAFLVLVAALAVVAQRFDGVFSPITIFGIGLFIYVVGIPVEVNLTGHRELLLDRLIPLPQSATDAVVPLAFVALGAFTCGYMVLARKSHTTAVAAEDDVTVAIRGLGLACIVAVAVMVALFAPSLLAMRDYAAASTERYSNPVFALGLTLTQFLVAMYGQVRARFGPHGLRDAVVFSSVLLAWGLYSNQKSPLVLAGLVVLGYLLRRYPRVPGSVLSAVVMLAPVSLVLAAISFSLFRGGASLDFGSRSSYLTSIEPAGPFLSIVEEMSQPQSTAPTSGFGESILNGLIGWIPRSLWPQRPLDLAEQFARLRVPDWQPGEGYGYSPFAEALHQAGPAGVAAYFLILGMCIALLRNLLTRWSTVSAYSIVSEAFYYVVIAYLLFTLFRGPFQVAVTTVVHGSALLVAAMVATYFAPRPVRLEPSQGRSG